MSGCGHILDIRGVRFGKLTAVNRVGRLRGKTFWSCRCDCGTETSVCLSELRRVNGTKSCGCLPQGRVKTHGMTKTPEYRAYLNARDRCENPKFIGWQHYGGRGIRFRFDGFEHFYAELGDRPTLNHQVDRIDNDGDYVSGNVRWATPKENSANRRRKCAI